MNRKLEYVAERVNSSQATSFKLDEYDVSQSAIKKLFTVGFRAVLSQSGISDSRLSLYLISRTHTPQGSFSPRSLRQDF